MGEKDRTESGEFCDINDFYITYDDDYIEYLKSLQILKESESSTDPRPPLNEIPEGKSV